MLPGMCPICRRFHSYAAITYIEVLRSLHINYGLITSNLVYGL